MDKREAAEQIRESEFHEFLGLELLEFDSGHVEISLPHHDGFNRGDDFSIHGGIIASLLDIAITYAVMSEVGTGVPTADLRIDYLRPALRDELVATGETIRVGNTVAIAQSELRQDHNGEEKTVAIGRGLLSTAAVGRD